MVFTFSSYSRILVYYLEIDNNFTLIIDIKTKCSWIQKIGELSIILVILPIDFTILIIRLPFNYFMHLTVHIKDEMVTTSCWTWLSFNIFRVSSYCEDFEFSFESILKQEELIVGRHCPQDHSVGVIYKLHFLFWLAISDKNSSPSLLNSHQISIFITRKREIDHTWLPTFFNRMSGDSIELNLINKLSILVEDQISIPNLDKNSWVW